MFLVENIIIDMDNFTTIVNRGNFSVPLQDVVTDPKHDLFVERVYCGHLFHHGCLNVYMKTPPFIGTVFTGENAPIIV